MKGLNKHTEEALLSFVSDVVRLPNESAKTHRFHSLVGVLFGGDKVVTDLAAGVEKIVRVDVNGKRRHRRVDNYYGNIVIEFEKNLDATLKTAEKQLREYSAGVWDKESAPFRPLLCVATDGIHWNVYLPIIKKLRDGKPTSQFIELQAVHSFTVTRESIRAFWFWLTSVLFRDSQVVPSAERFQVDFGSGSPIYVDAMRALRRTWKVIGKRPEPKLAYKTWKQYLTVTYGSLGSDDKSSQELYMKHCYLSAVSKFLAWAALSTNRENQNLASLPASVLSGDYFKSKRIENLVERDFFQWMSDSSMNEDLAPIWERVAYLMSAYDLTRLSQDVLKGIYQELVDPSDRHDLGEYYTPEWLCDAIVETVLPKDGFVSVIDPTCGSGSFLYSAIRHLLAHNQNVKKSEALKKILENVVGIDIHPLAVTIAKTTYLIVIRELIRSSRRSIQIPIYLADSLFLPNEVQQLSLGRTPHFEITFGGKSIKMPETIVHASELFDILVKSCASVASDHARTGKESADSLLRYIYRQSSAFRNSPQESEAIEALWELTEKMSLLIKRKENSIWSFVIRNGYKPAMLRKTFDYIIGNPPWLSYRYISDPDYQKEVKRRAVDEYRIAPKSQKLFTQMELATVFLIHTISSFGRDGARIAFVMPRSILSADQHDNIRRRDYSIPPNIDTCWISFDSYWDIKDVQPVFNVPCCVLFGSKQHAKKHPANGGKKSSYTLPAVEWSGRLPSRDVGLDQAKVDLVKESKTARLIYLGTRSALSTKRGSTKPTTASPYLSRFHQGATLVPRSFYFVEIDDLVVGNIDTDRVYWARTETGQAAQAKEPYKDVSFSGQVEGRFIYQTALSKHLLPFALDGCADIILPVLHAGGKARMVDVQGLRDLGYREMAKWMEKVERIWELKRKSKAPRQSVYEWLDYSGKLTAQNLNSKFVLLYNASGTNISAALHEVDTTGPRFVVDAKLYVATFETAEEGYYLSAILNSSVVNDAVKPFQSLGLQGERDIHKKILELAIPSFSTKDAAHKSLMKLAKQCHRKVSALLGKEEFPNSLARKRAYVRDKIASELLQIDKIVEKLLHA